MSAAAPHPVIHDVDVRLLELLSHGFTDEMIGRELALTAKDVRSGIQGAVHALGARNREHAVALALKTGLID
jgi:DNA-binding NarL/FixJ family response regulator